MSDPHDHQPDPAALDELQRAFGGSTDSDGGEERAARPESVGESNGELHVASRRSTSRTTDAAPGDVASGDVASGDVASGDVASGDVASGDVASGDVASGDAASTDAATGAGGDEPHESDEPHETQASAEDGAADASERRREVLAALGIDDQSDVEEEPGSPEPEEILIVEQEPLSDPTPTPPPSAIRIDDYGSDVIVDAPAHRSPVAPAAPASDGASPTVIAIDDDELPDAVYVEGDLDGTGTRTTVFIDDDETGDAIAPEIDRDVRRGIEPRLRARRAAVKRALGRKRLRWVLFGTVVLIIGVGVLALLGSGLFAIQEDNVTVTGVVYADSSLVDAVVDNLVGTPALLVDVQAAEDELESIPWVDQARVRVSFPHTVTIEIRERAAMTTYQGPDQRYRVLDREGRVLAVLDGYPIAYVLITGPDPVDLEAGQFAPQGYAAASELAKNLTDSIRGQVERIDVTSDGSRLVLYLDDGTEVRFGAARDLFNKLLRLETALANNPDREPGVIDVSTSEVTL